MAEPSQVPSQDEAETPPETLRAVSAPTPSPPGPGLLIAVTGGPGDGKTRLLAELAAWHATSHGRIDGFVSIAGHRPAPNKGADEYRVQLLATGEERTWQRRDERLAPPYRFDEETFAWLEAWARALPGGSPLVVLDEFSRLEAEGGGLMRLWPGILEARPRIVVMAVRSGLEAAIEARLRRRFDVRVSSTAPDALLRLQGACADFGEWTRIGLFGGASGAIETTVGTALHVANVPLRGLVLASLQGMMMTFAGLGLAQPVRVVWVPLISAGLKALSPGGSRLRPMLAIAAQGALFGAAVQMLGFNLLGVSLGGALVGAWAALQGFVLQYLALGQELVRAYDTAVLWLAAHWHVSAPGLPWLVGAWTALHGVAAGAAAVVAWRLGAPPRRLRELIDREAGRPSPVPEVGAAPAARGRRLVRDLTRWQLWLPAALVAAIMLTAGRPLEAVAWLALRFVAVSLVLLSLVSLVRPARWAEVLRRHGFWGPAVAMGDAIDRQGGTPSGTPAKRP